VASLAFPTTQSRRAAQRPPTFKALGAPLACPPRVLHPAWAARPTPPCCTTTVKRPRSQVSAASGGGGPSSPRRSCFLFLPHASLQAPSSLWLWRFLSLAGGPGWVVVGQLVNETLAAAAAGKIAPAANLARARHYVFRGFKVGCGALGTRRDVAGPECILTPGPTSSDPP
jgi:hypothetical protein